MTTEYRNIINESNNYIQLPLEHDQIQLPEGYILTKNGIYFIGNPKKGPQEVFSSRIYPVKIEWDEILNCEVIIIKHLTPFNRWIRVKIKSNLLNYPKLLRMKLHDHHAHSPCNKIGKKLFVKFLREYVDELRDIYRGEGNYEYTA